jgi:hypothetical protein
MSTANLGPLLVKSIKPLIAIAESTRRELAWGMSFDRVATDKIEPGHDKVAAFAEPAQDLGNAVLHAMKITEDVVNSAYQHSSMLRKPALYDVKLIEAAMQKLEHAQTVAKLQLRTISDAIDVEQRTSDNNAVDLPRDLFDVCLFVASLLQVLPTASVIKRAHERL